jgi:RNA polymerase sigma-70 factor (ECF subfamily)
MAGAPLETELLTAAIGGDREALQQLLFRRCPFLLRYLRSQCPTDLAGQIEVDDVLQDTLVTAVKGFPAFRGHSMGEFQGWLQTMAQHRLIDRIKHVTAQKRRESPVSTASQNSIVDLVSTLFDSHDTPARSCARREEIDAVRIAVAHLPKDQRQAMCLRYLEGKSTEETAAAMDRSPAAVRGLVNRAMVSLRELLGNSSRWFDWR